MFLFISAVSNRTERFPHLHNSICRLSCIINMRQISARETLMDLLFSQAMRTQEYGTGVYDTCRVINMHEDGLLKVWRYEGERWIVA